MAPAVIKTILLLSAALLVGAASARFLLLPGRADRHVTLGAWGGTLLLLGASVYDLYATIPAVLCVVDTEMFVRYATTSRHGEAVMWRSGAAVLLAVTVSLRPRAWTALVSIPLSLVVLGSFSYISHAAAMGGTMPLVLDLVHFLAAGVWAGGLLYVSLAPIFGAGASAVLRSAMERLSTVGLVSVGLLFVSGTVLSLVHAGEPDTFVSSPYVRSLIIKLVLVAAVVLIAAVNRFRILPALRRGSPPKALRSLLGFEAVLLVAVFAATGLLSTSELPHSGGADVNPASNLSRLIDYLWR